MLLLDPERPAFVSRHALLEVPDVLFDQSRRGGANTTIPKPLLNRACSADMGFRDQTRKRARLSSRPFSSLDRLS